MHCSATAPTPHKQQVGVTAGQQPCACMSECPSLRWFACATNAVAASAIMPDIASTNPSLLFSYGACTAFVNERQEAVLITSLVMWQMLADIHQAEQAAAGAINPGVWAEMTA